MLFVLGSLSHVLARKKALLNSTIALILLMFCYELVPVYIVIACAVVSTPLGDFYGAQKSQYGNDTLIVCFTFSLQDEEANVNFVTHPRGTANPDYMCSTGRWLCYRTNYSRYSNYER